MKYRIKVVTFENGYSLYFPQFKSFFPWFRCFVKEVSSLGIEKLVQFPTKEKARSFIEEEKRLLNLHKQNKQVKVTYIDVKEN